MPELPEVETIARGLDKRVTGDVIESVWLGSKREPLKSSAAEIVDVLESARIVRVRRAGKHIVFDLERGRRTGARGGKKPRKFRQETSRARAKPVRSGVEATPAPMLPGAQWIVHLGMTGRMVVCGPEQATEKHTHAIAKLKSGRELRFVDPRRFGRLSVTRGFLAAGSEPLEIDAQRFVGLFRGRRTPIKSALLNQK